METNGTGSEAACSWTVRYHAQGYDCMLTLRGPSGADVLTKADAAIRWLAEHGCTPDGCKPALSTPWKGAAEGANGNGSAQQPIAPPAPAMAVIPTPAPEPDPAWCPIHQVMMARHEKDGKGWYSHKVGDAWCRGKAR
jgi:hypothetical protein